MGTIGRKIYREVVINIQTGETLYEDSYIYEGPLALCDEADPPPADQPPADEPPPVDNTPPPDDQPPPDDEPPPPPPPTPLKYKSHEEAEEGYRNLEKKLGEQGNQVSEYRKQVEFLQRVAKGEITIDGTPVAAKPAAPPPSPDDGKPKAPEASAFYDADGGFMYDEYDDAKIRYAVDLAKWEWDRDTRTRQQQVTHAETVRKGIEAHEARIKKAAESDPAILDIIKDETLPMSNAMYAGITISEDGPAILRYLHEHRDDATRIFQLQPTHRRADGTLVESKTGNPFTVFYELGRIAGIVKSTPEQKPKIRSNAPPPHVPVGGNNGKAAPTGELASLAKSDPAEYLKRVHAGEE